MRSSTCFLCPGCLKSSVYFTLAAHPDSDKPPPQHSRATCDWWFPGWTAQLYSSSAGLLFQGSLHHARLGEAAGVSAVTPPAPLGSGHHHCLLLPAVLLTLHPLGFPLHPSSHSGSPFLFTLQMWASLKISIFRSITVVMIFSIIIITNVIWTHALFQVLSM